MIVNSARFRRIWVGIGVLIALFCTACGESSSERETGVNGYVFIPELIVKGQDLGIYKMKVCEGFLYYLKDKFLYRLSVGEKVDFTESREVMEIPAGGMLDYVPRPDQSLYYVAEEEKAWDARIAPRGCTLIKRLENGETQYKCFFPDIVVSGKECLAVNREGWAFLALEDGIYCVNPEGELTDSIGTGEIRKPEMKGTLFQGAEGRIYYCVQTSLHRYSLYEIVGKNSFQLVNQEGVPEKEITGIHSSEYGLLLDTKEEILYQYSLEDSGWRVLMQWGYTDMYHPSINDNQIVQIDEDKIVTCLTTDMREESTKEINLLTRKPVTELPEREEIVMASIYPSQELMQMVSEFNRKSSTYHITVETYLWGEVETKLNSRLVSSNPPDLLDVSKLDILNYAEKQTFEDLAPYLEKSSVLDREDFLKNLLEGYTVDGSLVCIPRCFSIHVTTGKTSLIGEEAGWTVEEFMEAAEKNQGLTLTDYESRASMLSGLFKQYLSCHYIDWDTGECRFDSEEFCYFLEWIKSADAVGQEDQTVDSYWTDSYWTEERLVTREAMLFMSDSAKMEILFGEEVTFKGDPTGDGSVYFPVEPMDAVGIVSGSRHKEGAWGFLEYILTHDDVNKLGFSSRRDLLMKAVKEEMTPEYWMTQDGEVIVQMGEPQIKEKSVYGPEFTPYYFMTQEQADALLEVFDVLNFTPTGGVKDEIIWIIIEESRSYLEGERTVEEAAKLIQNRVGTLVQENR